MKRNLQEMIRRLDIYELNIPANHQTVTFDISWNDQEMAWKLWLIMECGDAAPFVRRHKYIDPSNLYSMSAIRQAIYRVIRDYGKTCPWVIVPINAVWNISFFLEEWEMKYREYRLKAHRRSFKDETEEIFNKDIELIITMLRKMQTFCQEIFSIGLNTPFIVKQETIED